MTPEEAIGIVRCAIGEVEWDYPLDYAIAFETAIEALEKQVAKNPIKDAARIVNYQTFYCPICNKKIISRLDGNWIAGRIQKYCDDCGQALDWRETE